MYYYYTIILNIYTLNVLILKDDLNIDCNLKDQFIFKNHRINLRYIKKMNTTIIIVINDMNLDKTQKSTHLYVIEEEKKKV